MIKQILKVVLYGLLAFVLLSVSVALLFPSDNADESQTLPGSSVTTNTNDDEVLGEPEAADYTLGEKLAILDDNWSEFDLYNKRFEQVVERCPANTEQQLGDSIYLATQLLDERGITETSLWAMEGLLSAVDPSLGPDLDCRELLAGLVSLRLE